MGLIRKTIFAGAATGTTLVAYLGATTTLITPLPRDDPVWSSKSFKKLNIHNNPATQDVVLKRVPLEKIKPELLKKDGALVQEFCRGVWSGWGYRFQRAYLARKYQAETPDQLWSVDQLATSTYNVGTKLNDHFEIVDKTPTEIVVRCGDSPRNQGPRDSDGLFVIGATIDKERNEAVLSLKSCLFNGRVKREGPNGPMPRWMEELHQWYARLWMATAAPRLLK